VRSYKTAVYAEHVSVTISEDELIFIPSKTYTVADYLTQRGTTVEEEFERLTNMGASSFQN